MRMVIKGTDETIDVFDKKFVDINGSKRTVMFMTRVMHARTDDTTGEQLHFPYLEVVCRSKRDGQPMPTEWWEEEIFLKNNPKYMILED